MQEIRWEYLVLSSRGTEPSVHDLNAKGREGWDGRRQAWRNPMALREPGSCSQAAMSKP